LPGWYEFTLASDDGARLFIDGQFVTGEDGLHPVRGATGGAELAPGVHDLEVQYFEFEGETALSLAWTVPGGSPSEVPASALSSLACRRYDGAWKTLPFVVTRAISRAETVTTPVATTESPGAAPPPAL
jgi:hypothetical protein